MACDERHEIVIVGAGPAGLSTAMHLCRLDPSYADRLVVLDKARSPRNKVCGGAVTANGLDALRRLEIRIDKIPHQEISSIGFERSSESRRFPDRTGPAVFTRRELDRGLCDEASARGIRIREDARVDAIRRDGEHHVLRVGDLEYRARVVVGADGSAGSVSSSMFPSSPMMAGLRAEIRMTAKEAGLLSEFRDCSMTFDFRPIADGWRGYIWRFPAADQDGAVLNCGFFYKGRDRRSFGTNGRAYLERYIEQLGLAGRSRIEACPIRAFSFRRRVSAPGVLLVGDALGADPLLGEGISEAILGGRVAAEAIHEALSSGDLSFTRYRGCVLQSRVGSCLKTTSILARLFYGWTNAFWMNMIFRSTSVRRFVEERFPGYPNFYQHKRELLLATLRWAAYGG